jgi:hypothetical protein
MAPIDYKCSFIEKKRQESFLPKKIIIEHSKNLEDLFEECTQKKFISKEHIYARGWKSLAREEIALRLGKLMIISLEIYVPLFRL